MQFFLCSCCCCCRTFELRRELPCFTWMTLYSLTVTLALFYALFAVERGCTVLVCVGGGWRCSIHSIAIDLHVCKRGESLALFSASLVVVVDVSHSSFLWQIRLHSRFDLRHRHTHTHSCCCGRGGESRKRWGENFNLHTRRIQSLSLVLRVRLHASAVFTRLKLRPQTTNKRSRQPVGREHEQESKHCERALCVCCGRARSQAGLCGVCATATSLRSVEKWECVGGAAAESRRERECMHVVVALLRSQRVGLQCSGS